MSRQSLNLPINIPWKQISVSPDMMDDNFCNKLFPFAWRSSMAISVYEPKPEDLPEELCGDQITYVKITTSITGYQPSEEDTKDLDKILGEIPVRFPDLPKEDLKEAIKRIKDDYFACYGVLLNVAVFPYPKTKKKLIERNRIDFSKIREQAAPNNTPFFGVGTKLDNPYEHSTGVKFETSDQQQNNLVNLLTLGNNTDAELNLHEKMVISIPATQGLAAVEAKVVYLNNAGVKMEAYGADGLVGTETSEAAPNQVHTLIIKADNIEKVVIFSSENKASLLEFAYFTNKEVALELEDYPHIIDFEPKRRDLYQAATEAGEVLTGSNSSLTTNKALTHTESTESSISFGASIAGVIPIPELPIGVNSSINTNKTNRETDEDKWSVQTDASRERRETQGTTTQLSQMYNLLTGYHAGTNRASFLSLARPHVLQPTDYRTFVQGLRAIEGMQEYFLIVSRPKGVEGLCIETVLESGHYPENTIITKPPEEFDESELDYLVAANAKGAEGGGWWSDDAKCVDIDEVFLLPGNYVVDQRPERGWDLGHPGVAFLNQDSQPMVKNLNYQVTDGSLRVTGKLCGGKATGGIGGLGKLKGLDHNFDGIFRVFLRSEQPKTSYQEPYSDVGQLLITSRGLCTCFKSDKCLEVVPQPKRDPIVINHIVDEPIIRINKALMTKNASQQNRMPLAKEFLSKVKTALTSTYRRTSRHAFNDKVGFLESDYFKNQIKNLLPETHLKTPISKVKGLPDEIVKTLGANLTIDQALSIDLASFALRTGLSTKEASKIRHLLLGISQTYSDNTDSEIK